MSSLFLYIGAGLTIVWGISHLFATRGAVENFGNISIDNRRIITMEWITEGVTLIFIGFLVASITAINQNTIVSSTVYIICAFVLFVMSIVSLFTGFRVNFLPYKLCPVIFSASAILFLLGWIT